jgi:hypothetical protein
MSLTLTHYVSRSTATRVQVPLSSISSVIVDEFSKNLETTPFSSLLTENAKKPRVVSYDPTKAKYFDLFQSENREPKVCASLHLTQYLHFTHSEIL